jgi:hypothetical protein
MDFKEMGREREREREREQDSSSSHGPIAESPLIYLLSHLFAELFFVYLEMFSIALG